MSTEYQIIELDKAKWKGTIVPVAYVSEEYYDLSVDKTDKGFEIPIEKKRFETPFVKTQEDQEIPDGLYADWWEKARAFGITEGDELYAVIEVCPEEWSHRLMVTELYVCEKLRKKGYGRKLMDLAKKMTEEGNYRALILETQSSNVNAVDFYLHEGFTLIGFDSCAYTNEDLKRKEVRLNMGWFPESKQ